jgi:arylsulfatase A-like enzyme/Tfp pilus assembly protein PilF
LKRLALAALLAVFAISGCNRSERKLDATHSYDGVPVILVSIDTLRADHLSIYGSKSVRTPAFEALARESIVFDNGISHVPLTVPSHLSAFTGKLPQETGVRDNIGFRFDATKSPTLAALLKGGGYSTGAAVSAYVLRRDSGVNAGFDDYEDSIAVIPSAAMSNLYRRGAETIAIAQNWIAAHKEKKFFYFLHMYEPHAPYEPPVEYTTQYADAYSGEVAYSDALLGGFLDWLKQNGIYDRALIIVFSDHGEGLMEHGEQEHGILLYRNSLHVPLLVKLPQSQSGGTRVSAAVGLRNIFSTVLTATGLHPPAGAPPSLLAIAGEKNEQPSVFSETMYPRIHLGWSDLRSLTTATHQFIDAPTPELYDVTKDPVEKSNILANERRVFARFRKEMEQYAREIALPQNIDPEEAAKLAALGYISATKPTTEANLPDPKDRIGEIEEVKRAFKLASQHDYEGAIRVLTVLVERNPRWTDAWTKIATCYEALADYKSAEETYRRAIEVAPTLAPEYALSLASMLLKQGKFDDAAKHAELALRDNPGGAHQVLGEIAVSRNDLATASREAALTAENPQYRLQGLLLSAQVDAAAGRLPETLAKLEQLEREAGGAHRLPFAYLEFVRGDALARLDRYPEAEAAFEKEIRAFPQNRQAYANLALVYLVQQKSGPAYSVLERMVAANPDKHTYLFAAKTLDTLGDSRGAEQWRRKAAAVQ